MKRMLPLLLSVMLLCGCAGLAPQQPKSTAIKLEMTGPAPAMNSGKNLLLSFEQADQHYDLVVIKDQSDPVTWTFQLFQGINVWMTPGVYGDPIYVLGESYPGTPEACVQGAVDAINAYLQRRFGSSAPATRKGQLEALIIRIMYFSQEGIPQVKIQM